MSGFGDRKLSFKEILSSLNLSRSWLLLILFLFALHMLTIGFEFFYFNELSAYLRIRRSGVSATGRVITKHVVEDSEGPDSCYVEYFFNHDLQVYDNEHMVDWETYQTLDKGGEVDIRYLVSNPYISRIGGQAHPDFLFFTMIMLIVCIPYQAYSIYLLLSTVRNVRRFYIESKEAGELDPNIK
jgi:hypothetical protein